MSRAESPSLEQFADEFAEYFGRVLSRCADDQVVGNSGGWPGAARREFERRLRAAVAERLIGGSDERLSGVIADYRRADDAMARCLVNCSRDDAWAAGDRVETLSATMQDLADEMRGEAVRVAPEYLEVAQ